MNVFSSIGSEHEVTLEQAILIYRSRPSGSDSRRWDFSTQGGVIATVHTVTDNVISAGVVATEESVRHLTADLTGRTAGMTLIPSHVLAISSDYMAWHSPASRRRMWFQPADSVKAEAADLVKFSGEHFPQPPLLFIAGTHGLRVFALKSGNRPTERTTVYRAPYWNVGNSGNLCVGSTRLPKDLLSSNIPGFEAAFFQSRFTHPTIHGCQLAKTRHSLLWTKLANKRAFPIDQLVSTKRTLGQLLAQPK
jgi:PRTRC genetic system protein B